MSLRGHNIATYPPISTYADLVNAYNWCSDPKGSVGQFETIILDSVTEIAEVVLENEKRKTKDGRMAYGEANSIMLNYVVRRFRDIQGKNVVFLAKEDVDKDGLTGVNVYGPSMPGKVMRQELPYFFDEVFRMVSFTDATTGATQVWFQTAIDATTIAKDRSGRLSQWEQPHLANVFAKIQA